MYIDHRTELDIVTGDTQFNNVLARFREPVVPEWVSELRVIRRLLDNATTPRLVRTTILARRLAILRTYAVR